MDAPFQSTDDLRNMRVCAALRSSGEEFLIRENIGYTPFKDVQEAIDHLLRREVDAVVSNVPVLLYLNKFKYNHQLLIAQRLLLKNNMGIAVQEESPLKEKIDRVLLEKIAEAKWQQAVYKYLGEDFN